MLELLLQGGTVIDGTGRAAFAADVGVAKGRIVAVGALGDVETARTIDVEGRLVCPGFIDLHGHSDLTLLSNPLAHSKVRQGVTTELVGNCGLSVTGLSAGADVEAVRRAVNYLDVDAAVAWTWKDQRSYFETLDAARTSINVAALVGHVALRGGAVGFFDRPASAVELEVMRGQLADCLDAGAVGLSTGLAYAPACFASTEELTELARVVADRGKLFAWHLRDYGDHLADSASQAIDIARATGCRTQISHLVAVGRRNWGAVAQVLELVDEANSHGADVAVDVYPYIAGNTMLSQLLPDWARQGDEATMRSRLADAEARRRIREAWSSRTTVWSDFVIGAAPGHDGLVGSSVEAIAREHGVDGAEAALDLLEWMGNSVIMTAFGRSDDDVRTVYAHAASIVGSDGLALDRDGPTGRGVPHPRSYGTYPRLFARYADGLSFEQIVHKSSGAVATRLGLDDRGVLAAGRCADLVVVDPDRVEDTATYADPHRYPNGIDLVVVNGAIVVENRSHTGAQPGHVLRLESERVAR